MSTPENPDPADFAGDEDDAAIDEALEALTSGMPLTATAEEDEELGEDIIGEAEEFDEEDEEDDGTDDAADDLIGALEVPMAADAPINFEEPGADMDAMPIEELRATPIAVALPEVEPAPATDRDRRLAELEELAKTLIDAEKIREDQRVKRKVKASATGAAGAGLVPVVLMLTGAFNLDPELAATLSAGVAALASFMTGYLTPERRPPLDQAVAQKVSAPRQ
jgi:hypothetical protein